MNSKERRKYIEEILIKIDGAEKGQNIADELGVTRQVIVKDIAILRAEGKNIIATPEGYLIPEMEKSIVSRVLALYHKAEDIEDELSTIVKFGGVVKDVIIEHPLYGELRGMLMIKTQFDVQNFVESIDKYKAEPLSILTSGVHLHTIESENEEIMQRVTEELKIKGYLISD